jgi:hypothetical protein
VSNDNDDSEKLRVGKPGQDADGNPLPDYAKEPVPKVPRRGNYRWAMRDIVRIIFLAGLLAMVIVARKPCSNAVANFVDGFDEQPEKPKAGGIRENDKGELIGPDGKKLERLTPAKIEELRKKQEAERAKQQAESSPTNREAEGSSAPAPDSL